MTDALITRLRKLQDALDAEVIDQNAYQSGLDKLRKEYGAPEVDAARAALTAPAARDHSQTVSGNAQTGAAVAGDVGGSVVAPLFPEGAGGNYIAGVINLYQHAPAASQADYGAALHHYLEDLHHRYATLDLRGIDERTVDLPLTDLYISLVLHQPRPSDIRGRGGVRRFMDKVRGTLAGGSVEPVLESEPPRAVSWAEALGSHDRLTVVGAPGSGKTTLLHYTAIRLAEGLARDDLACLAEVGLSAPLVPVLLPLRELGIYLKDCRPRELSGSSPRLLLECLTNYYNARNLELPGDFFSRLCDQGRALLLLDGLDEVADTHDRELVSAIVRECALRYRTCRYVVTTRVAAYQGDAEIGANFRICTVDDLDEAQQRRFTANWCHCVYRLVYPAMRTEQQEYAAAALDAALWLALEQNAGVRWLAPNPLLLTVVAIVFYNHQDLPENRAALYEECVKVLLRGGRGKVDAAGRLRAEYSGRAGLAMGLEARRDLLAVIAYAMHAGGEERKLLDRGDLLRIVVAYLRPRVGGDAEASETANAFLSELPVHLGLLDEREPNRFGFSHLSFQEFLVARHLANTDQWEALLAHYRESYWREVILLCAGHLSQERCWRFLHRLGQQGETPQERATALELAAAALTELERFKGQGPIRTEIRDAALALVLAPPLEVPAVTRVTCGGVLARLGDPRPHICTLPPTMAPIAGRSFLIGSTSEQARQAGERYEQYYLAQGDKKTAKHSRAWPEDEINERPINLASFAIGRYPVTNAQFALFIADSGYEPDQPWWDAAGRAWLGRDDQATEGLRDWRCRRFKNRPEWWDDSRVGQARPNQSVVGVSWYEAVAFCRWLSGIPKFGPN